MSFFLLVLLGFFIWFIVRPLWIARRNWNNLQQQARRFYEQQFSGARPGPHTQPQPSVKKKKIDPNVGEYVEFTETDEVSTERTADGSVRSDVHSESQITDITWEDIPSDGRQ